MTAESRPPEEKRSLLPVFFDLILFQLAIKRSPRNIQDLGRFFNIFVVCSEKMLDVFLLQILQGAGGTPKVGHFFGKGGQLLLETFGKVDEVDEFLPADKAGVLDGILHLSNIPGPAIDLEKFLDLAGDAFDRFLEFLIVLCQIGRAHV